MAGNHTGAQHHYSRAVGLHQTYLAAPVPNPNPNPNPDPNPNPRFIPDIPSCTYRGRITTDLLLGSCVNRECHHTQGVFKIRQP